MEKIKQKDMIKPEELMNLQFGLASVNADNEYDRYDKTHLTNKIMSSKSLKITTVLNFVKCEYEDESEGDGTSELPVLMYGIIVDGKYLSKSSLGNRERFIDDKYEENKKWKVIFPIYLIGDGCIMSSYSVYNRVNKFLFVRGLAEIIKNKIEGFLNEGVFYNNLQEIQMSADINAPMLVWYVKYKNNNGICERIKENILTYHPICNEYPECLKELAKEFPEDFPELGE